MVLDYCQNLVSAQYLEKALLELDKICLCIGWDLGWDCYLSIFTNIQHSYGLWLLSEFQFHSISWKQTD